MTISKAVSTFVEFKADVSMKNRPSASARLFPSSTLTFLIFSKSLLLPTSIIATVRKGKQSQALIVNNQNPKGEKDKDKVNLVPELSQALSSMKRNQTKPQVQLKILTLELIEPAADTVEGGPAADIVDDESTDSASVVGRGDGTESLLTSGVPNLGLDFLAVDFQALCLKLNANGCLRVGIELVAGVAGEQVGFADGGIADYDDFEEVLFTSLVVGRHV
ncbi:hypothetical protein G2W53_005576 [Senna tora]|uniref:Uncharacterized protein n=1 Tax=Senna tora TaxID=362788 RepID=A0A834X391_9FABA|nr:hypothetical protein G2W53_005576 [Senna tora]